MRSIIEEDRQKFLDTIKACQDALSAKQDALSAKQDALSAKQDALSAKQDALSAKLSETENSVKLYSDKKALKIGELTSRFISAAMINRETFSPFRNWCRGKKLVICGAGPSLKDYIPIDGAVHIALNRAFLFDKVQFDFIFCQDFEAINMYQKELVEYKGNNCQKFFGEQCYDFLASNIPISFSNKCNAKKFVTDIFTYSPTKIEDFFRINFVTDIDSCAIGNFSNVALSVMQFALWMNPNEIYIVGCDHSGGHFTTQGLPDSLAEVDRSFTTEVWRNILKRTRRQWRALRQFAQVYYPDTKIISVNPVGLKGIFIDWNQVTGEIKENVAAPIPTRLDNRLKKISNNTSIPDYPMSKEKCFFSIDKKEIQGDLIYIEGWAYKNNDEIDVYARLGDKIYCSKKIIRGDVKELFSLDSVDKGFQFYLPHSDDVKLTLYFVNETEEEIYQAEI